jgi:hypothetical protein
MQVNHCESVFVFPRFLKKEVLLEPNLCRARLIMNHHDICMVLKVKQGILHLLICHLLINSRVIDKFLMTSQKWLLPYSLLNWVYFGDELLELFGWNSLFPLLLPFPLFLEIFTYRYVWRAAAFTLNWLLSLRDFRFLELSESQCVLGMWVDHSRSFLTLLLNQKRGERVTRVR